MSTEYEYLVESSLMRIDKIKSSVPFHKGEIIRGTKHDYEITDIIHKDYLDRIDDKDFEKSPTHCLPILKVKRLD
jgi:hypothetical protein